MFCHPPSLLWCFVVCSTREAELANKANKPGRPIRGLDWQDKDITEEQDWTVPEKEDLYENTGWVPSSLSSPCLRVRTEEQEK